VNYGYERNGAAEIDGVGNGAVAGDDYDDEGKHCERNGYSVADDNSGDRFDDTAALENDNCSHWGDNFAGNIRDPDWFFQEYYF
jgi:hypothetical protein